MEYNLYLFDLDGTLTNPQIGMEKSMRYALNALDVKTEIKDFSVFIGPPLRDTFREAFGLTGERAEEAVTKYREYYATKGIYENEIYEGIIEMLKRLKERGAKIAMATSKCTIFAEVIANHFNFAQYFDFIGGSELNGDRSTKAEVISHVLENISSQRLRPVMIGDRKYDIEGAKATGIDSIGVTWGFGSVAELKEAGAMHIINSPSDTFSTLKHR
ncbi:MAG: HAD hydrolase-like protein [Defluviitaleaceae bacterium]|nr:HAD hydrolase-like protein [Defluviitaleaceae bacterium]